VNSNSNLVVRWTRLVAAGVGTAAATSRRPDTHARALARSVLVVLGALTLAAAGVSGARAEGVAAWRLEPAQAPPPPAGVAPAPYPVPVGQVGEISFWAPNRGLLITGGTEPPPWNGPVAPGLYAYDGVSWHQLSTVCGGGEGRIAWAGPDEFWTISDQRAGQVVAPGQQGPEQLRSISLCHFLNGQVVGSYAMPLEEPDSYLKMDAAACYGPDDCWFGGADGNTPNVGAFHLHWDGATVTAVYEPEDHAVTDMGMFESELYESVQIQEGDVLLPVESTKHPAVIHTIAPAGQSSLCDEVESPFCELVIFPGGRFLPEYEPGAAHPKVLPDALQGFSLATDGGPLGAGATQLWAAASPLIPPPVGSERASLTVLRDVGGEWTQIVPNAKDESPLSGLTLAGATSDATRGGGERGTSDAIAPEPGSDSAWLSLGSNGSHGAVVARLEANGKLAEPAAVLPEVSEPVGYHGEAGPIACPAPHDCWLATTAKSGPTPGWLFHLGGGAPLAQNTDPMFDGEDGVITYRPPDSGVPTIYPDAPPEDDSLANQQPPPPPAGPPVQTPAPPAKQVKPLLTHVKSRLLHHSVLVISFTLTARAYVQLVGRRKHRVVASSRSESLKPGRHELSLRLDPARWPTGVQFEVTPLGVSAPSGGGSGESGSNEDTIAT
jgi:hypothetical protein